MIVTILQWTIIIGIVAKSLRYFWGVLTLNEECFLILSIGGNFIYKFFFETKFTLNRPFNWRQVNRFYRVFLLKSVSLHSSRLLNYIRATIVFYKLIIPFLPWIRYNAIAFFKVVWEFLKPIKVSMNRTSSYNRAISF